LEQRPVKGQFSGTDGANVHESHTQYSIMKVPNSLVGFQEEDEDPMSLGVASGGICGSLQGPYYWIVKSTMIEKDPRVVIEGK